MIATRELASVSRFVEAGSVIGPMPEIVAAATGCPLVRLLPDWHVSRARLHAITSGGREAPARVRVFRDFIRSELTELGANGKAAGSCSRCRATTGATPLGSLPRSLTPRRLNKLNKHAQKRLI
jgi:hypothetical protein